jgi:hypothetical protein
VPSGHAALQLHLGRVHDHVIEHLPLCASDGKRELGGRAVPSEQVSVRVQLKVFLWAPPTGAPQDPHKTG